MSERLNVEDVRAILRDAGMSEPLVSSLEASASLLDAGVDSLDMANALLMIEERHGVKIPDEEALELDSLEAIAALVNRKLA